MEFPVNLVLDTNIFSNNKYHFEDNKFYNLLTKMVKNNEIKLYLSRIVIEEVRAHIYSEMNDEIETINKKIDKFRNCYPKTIVDSLGLPEKLILDKGQTNSSWDSFISDYNVEIMEYDDITIEQIFTDYFERKPPFEEKKKEEFPDSVIFHQVKARFSHEKPVYVLSKDNGLSKALKELDYCQVYDDYNELFNLISEQNSDYTQALKEIQVNLNTFINYFKEHEIGLLRQTTVNCQISNIVDQDFSTNYDIDTGNVSIIKDKQSPIRIAYFDEQTINASLQFTFQATIGFHYNHFGLFKEEWQVHKCLCWVDFIWNREKKIVEKCIFNHTFSKDTMISSARGDAEIITFCPDCGKPITNYNNGGNGFCIDCAPSH